MLRKLSNFALLMGAILLTGCLKNDNDDKKGQEYIVTEGAYIVNAGDPAHGVDGSLTYIDYSNGTAIRICCRLWHQYDLCPRQEDPYTYRQD